MQRAEPSHRQRDDFGGAEPVVDVHDLPDVLPDRLQVRRVAELRPWRGDKGAGIADSSGESWATWLAADASPTSTANCALTRSEARSSDASSASCIAAWGRVPGFWRQPLTVRTDAPSSAANCSIVMRCACRSASAVLPVHVATTCTRTCPADMRARPRPARTRADAVGRLHDGGIHCHWRAARSLGRSPVIGQCAPHSHYEVIRTTVGYGSPALSGVPADVAAAGRNGVYQSFIAQHPRPPGAPWCARPRTLRPVRSRSVSAYRGDTGRS